MKNKLDDLVNCLFSQLERFDDDEICKDQQSTKMELEKANAVSNLAGRIIANTNSAVTTYLQTSE